MPDRVVRLRSITGEEHDVAGSGTDAGVLLSIVDHEGRYGRSIEAALLNHVPRDGVVIDVGANIGVLTVLASAAVPEGSVVAFEPAEENLQYLRRNTQRRRNVTIVEAAVAAHDGVVHFDANADYPAGAHVSDHGALVVPCRSLDSWVAEHGLDRVDAIKIDVEGAEPQVLQGARDTIARFRPIVLAECNPAALRRVSGVSVAEFVEQLQELVPVVAMVRPDGRFWPVDQDDLELALGADGIVDLAGIWAKVGARTRLEARRSFATRRRELRAAPPDPHNFVVTAPITMSVAAPSLSGTAGEELVVDVRVQNGSRWWLSPHFVYHPVNVGARWGGRTEAGRGSFAAPVRPGATAVVPVPVRLPEVAGTYELEVSLVQEHYAWLVEIDPRCRLVVDVQVLAAARG